MITRLLTVSLLLVSFLLGGCATVKTMPFSKDPAAAPDSGKAIFLMTATMKNDYKPSYQPDLLVVNIERPGATSSKDRFNFQIDDKGKIETDQPTIGNTYFIRFELDPGTYVIDGLTCLDRSFPIVASFFAPLHEKLVVTKPGVYYLGHVSATVRERVGNEFKAGASIPLIDQAVAGASGGTFDIAISDAFKKDQVDFVSRFPGLQGVAITKEVMPPFDRAYAQKWWETH